MDCPLCGKKIKDGPEVSVQELYEHINSAFECPCKDAKCPTCGKEFFYGADAANRPWLRLAVHWHRFGHLYGDEHVIVAAMEGEPSIPNLPD